MTAKLRWRPHRFPRVAELAAGTSQSGVPARASAPSAADYQIGMERGYRDGHASGLEAGRTAGYAEGRRQGLEDGLREARARFEGIAAPLDAMLESLRRLQEDYQAALRREVVDLVAKVARQVIRRELTLEPAQLVTLIDETLASMPHASDSGIEVYLAAEDYERIRDLDPVRAKHWKLVVDPRLEPGECRIKAGSHEADAGCRQRLAACMEQIAAQLQPSTPDTEAVR